MHPLKSARWALVVIVLVCFCSPSEARRRRGGDGFGLNIEPIIGYERVQKLTPTPHTRDRLVYGARLTLGVPLLSAEAEYTRGRDSETFTSPNLTVTDTDDKLRVGARSQFKLNRRRTLHLVARAGVQAKRNIHEEDDGVNTTRVEEPIAWDPYAGAGARVRLGRRSKIDFVADLVVVFNDLNDLSKNDYILTSGFSIRI